MAAVIVAVPAEQDPVWKYSSEKIPHMTLLFLGDQLGNEEKVAEFLQHVANTSVNKFGLSVERRGTLGPDQADVLFFETGIYAKTQIDRLKNLRDTLLQQEDIAAAYNSAEQFPEWTPHLTMGYPESPAKQDDRDYPGFSWVNFDRLALWTGDFDGPEFLLKEQEFAMSDRVEEFLAHQGVTLDLVDDDLDDFLEHHGVKGMRWGKRKGLAGRADAAIDRKLGKKIERRDRVASGTAKGREYVSEFFRTNTTELAMKGFSLKKVAAAKSAKDKATLDRLHNGEATVKDKLRTYGTLSLADLARGGN